MSSQTVVDESKVIGTKDGVRISISAPLICHECKQATNLHKMSYDDCFNYLRTEPLKAKPKEDKWEEFTKKERGEETAKDEAGTIHTINDVFNYARFAQVSYELMKEKTFLEFIIAKQRWLKANYNFDFRNLTPALTVMPTINCQKCGSKIIFTVSAEATTEPSPLFVLPPPSGMLLSEWQSESLGKQFEIEENISGETVNRLVEAQTLLKVLEEKPLDFDSKEWEKIKWKIRWDTPNKPKAEQIQAFENRIASIRRDMEKVKAVSDKIVAGIGEGMQALEMADSHYVLREVQSLLEKDLPDKILRGLRRQFAENLVWLSDEVAYLIGQGEI